MKIIEKKLSKHHPLPSILTSYLPDAKLAVLDIETTGLSPLRHQIILIGVILIEEDHLLARQFFAENLSEEDLILDAFAETAQDVDVFFNYNGDSFDIPFINKRCSKLGFDFAMQPNQSMDIYRVLRHSYFKDILPNLKLKTVEKLFSDDRSDTISGGESVLLYQRYMHDKNQDDVKKILLHNLDDIRLLYEILPVFGKLDVHKVAFAHGFFVHYDMPFSTEPFKIFVEDIRIQRNVLSFKATCAGFSAHLNTYYADCHVVTDPLRHRLDVRLPIQTEPHFSYIDLIPLGLADRLNHLPGFYSGFLLIHEGPAFDHMTLNALVKDLICKIIESCGILKS